MDNWFTIEQIDRDTFSISEYKHWEETHCYLLCGEKYAIVNKDRRLQYQLERRSIYVYTEV